MGAQKTDVADVRTLHSARRTGPSQSPDSSQPNPIWVRCPLKKTTPGLLNKPANKNLSASQPSLVTPKKPGRL
jgi:hypothetical protein